MSSEGHGLSNHQLLNCLFNSLFRLSSKKTSKFPFMFFCGFQVDSPHIEPVIRKAFPCHNLIVNSWKIQCTLFGTIVNIQAHSRLITLQPHAFQVAYKTNAVSWPHYLFKVNNVPASFLQRFRESSKRAGSSLRNLKQAHTCTTQGFGGHEHTHGHFFTWRYGLWVLLLRLWLLESQFAEKNVLECCYNTARYNMIFHTALQLLRH